MINNVYIAIVTLIFKMMFIWSYIFDTIGVTYTSDIFLQDASNNAL